MIGRTPRILVADDSELIRRMIQVVLARDGLEVDTVSNGGEAIERMLRDPPDALLLDLLMPLMDGMEVLRTMSAEPALARIPVMVLTSSGLQENVQEALRNGARDFVVKPFDPDELWSRVKRLLAGASPAAEPPPQKGQLPDAPEARLVLRAVAVDDQAIVRQAAREMLEDRFEVFLAASGPGALDLAARLRPDLVLLELAAPMMPGSETLGRLRDLPGLGHTRYVAIVAGPTDTSVPNGFHDAVGKPFVRADLLAVVGRVLEIRGLFSFAVDGDATILRLHPRPLSDADVEHDEAPALVWDKPGLEELRDAVDRACAQMLAADRTWFVLDASPLLGLPDHLGAAFATAARGALARARECRFHCRLVVPPALQRHFLPPPEEPHAELYASIRDLRLALSRQIELGEGPARA
jgi:CheY-like chemotaxis protein